MAIDRLCRRRSSIRNFNPEAHLDGGIQGHFGDAQGDARVPAGFSEELDQQF
jgi:hypothetical protein